MMRAPTPTTADPESRAAARELGAIVEAAIDELPEIYRAVLMLREIEGLGTEEAADVLVTSEDVVKTRLHRARALLRDRLYERIGAAADDVFRFADPRCDRVVAGVLGGLARRNNSG
jgi:RNA polymerase sigma-70 factor, ECF subfamily